MTQKYSSSTFWSTNIVNLCFCFKKNIFPFIFWSKNIINVNIIELAFFTNQLILLFVLKYNFLFI